MAGFEQRFSMPYEQADGKEIFVNFTAYFEREFLDFDWSGDIDRYGSYQTMSVEFDDPNNETEELTEICKDYANDNVVEPEAIYY